MEQKTKTNVQKLFSIDYQTSGLLVKETVDGKPVLSVLLFGNNNSKSVLLLKSHSQIYQFEINKQYTQLEIDKEICFDLCFCCLVVGDQDALQCGCGASGKIGVEEIEQLLIAKEKPDMFSHFCDIVDDVLETKKKTFAEEILPLVFEIFCFAKPDNLLSSYIQNTRWVKISNDTNTTLIGMKTKGDNIESVGVAFPVVEKSNKNSYIDSNFWFVPISENDPSGFGFWVVMQNIKTGKAESLPA